MAVRIAMEHPIGALPCTPFASSRRFTHREACHWIRGSLLSPMNPVPLPPQGETRDLRRKNSESYTSRTISAFSPFGGWRHHLPAPVGSVSLDSQSPAAPCESSSLATPSSRGHYQAPLCCERLMKGLLCRSLLSHKCRFPGDHRCLFFCYHTYRDTNISERTENYEAGNDRTGMHY